MDTNEQIAPRGTELADDIGETTETAWIAPADMTYEAWNRIGHTLQQVNRSLNWWIGDWLREGEKRYGETYAQAVEVTDSSVESLRKYKQVAERIKPDSRNGNVSWSHHLLVAYLDPAEHKPLLDVAERFELPTRSFKQLVDLPDGDRASVIATAVAGDFNTREFYALLESFSQEFVNPIIDRTEAATRVGKLAGLRPAEVPPDFPSENDWIDPEPAQPELFDLGPDPFAETVDGEFVEGEVVEDSNGELYAAWESLGLPLEAIEYDAVSWFRVGISVRAEIDDEGLPVLAWTLNL